MHYRRDRKIEYKSVIPTNKMDSNCKKWRSVYSQQSKNSIIFFNKSNEKQINNLTSRALDYIFWRKQKYVWLSNLQRRQRSIFGIPWHWISSNLLLCSWIFCQFYTLFTAHYTTVHLYSSHKPSNKKRTALHRKDKQKFCSAISLCKPYFLFQ